MNLRLMLLCYFTLLNCLIVLGQKKDSLYLKVTGVESRELLDLYRMEDIDYYQMKFSEPNIQKKYFVITSNEYWNGKSLKTDTIVNTKLHGMKIESDTLGIRVMAKKIKDDTIKFQFHFPRFSTTRLFKTTKKNTYSLRKLTENRKRPFFDKGKPLNILAYSLPYEDPKKPGYLYYCELTSDGIPPEKWGEKFKVTHYIVFKIHLID